MRSARFERNASTSTSAAFPGRLQTRLGAAANQPGTWNTVGLGNTLNLLDLSGAPTSVEISVTADFDDGNKGGCGGDLQALQDFQKPLRRVKS